MKKHNSVPVVHFDCRIRFMNHLDNCWLTWFEGLSVQKLSDGEMLIYGNIPDREALFGLINKIRDLNLKVISISVTAQKG